MNLAELKEAYKARKLALDSAKKEEEKYKALLKDAMLEAGESDYTDEAGYRFERIVQERKSMDEEKLLAELHERNLTGCIKTVEAVDEDAALKAKRYRWIIYSWGYGDEVYDLIGYSYSEEYLNSEVRRYMEECLFENEHITGVQDLEVSQIKDVLHIKFTLVTDVGSKEVEMDV